MAWSPSVKDHAEISHTQLTVLGIIIICRSVLYFLFDVWLQHLPAEVDMDAVQLLDTQQLILYCCQR